jgi:phosphatidylglycerol:prolipoprotein diacylglycerol transferase
VRPTLFELFGQPVPAYFTFLVSGFAVVTWLAARWARRQRLDHDVMIDLGLFSLIAGVVGARLLHVLADGYFWDYVHLCTDPTQVDWRVDRALCRTLEGVWDEARGVCKPAHGPWTLDGCLAWTAFWRGGLTYYGGLILASATGLWLLHRERFPMLKGADVAGMMICLGLFFGRLGCFLGGCCFGQPTALPIGVRFPAWSPASDAQFKAGLLETAGHESLPVHPTQLYEAFGCLGLAALLMLVLHPRKRFDGQLFLLFLAGYSVLRFAVEALRADQRGELLGLSTSQLLSAGMLLGVLAAWRPVRALAAETRVGPGDPEPRTTGHGETTNDEGGFTRRPASERAGTVPVRGADEANE